MNKYYDSLNDEVKEYFSILSPEFPEWLLEYIDTPEMERISKISISWVQIILNALILDIGILI